MSLKRLIIILLSVCSSFFAFAQRETATRAYYQKLQNQIWNTIETYDSLLFGMKPTSSQAEPISFQRTEDSTYNNTIDTAVQLSLRVLRSYTGLELSTGYTYSTTVGETFFPDIEDDWGYQHKWSTTLSWDLMRSSLVGKKSKREIVSIQGDIDKIKFSSQQGKNLYQEALNAIDQKYNGYILKILKTQEELLSVIQSVYEEMYRHSDALIDDLYEINFKKKIINHSISLQKDVGVPEFLFHKDLFIYYNIDPEKFTELSLQNDDQILISEKELEIAEKKNNMNRYIYDMRIVPFARYQYLIYPTMGQRDVSNFQAGVNVTIPLSRSARLERRAGEKQIVVAQQNHELLSSHANRKATDMLNRTTKLANRLQTVLYELTNYGMEFRLLKFRNIAKPHSINGLKALKSMDRYLELLLNLYFSRMDYEKQLLDIKLLAGDADFSEFSTPEYLDGDMSLNLKPKSTYLWSSYHSTHPIPEIASQVWKNNINAVYISYNSRLPNSHYIDLIDELSRYRIKSYLCISNNDLVLQSKEEIMAYLDRCSDIPADGLHLNVEPHQFKDWNEKKQSYVDGLLLTISTSKAWCGARSYELSASVPHTYPNDFYVKAMDYLDVLTLMLYNKDITTINSLLSSLPYLSDKKSALEIALRPEDFIPDFSLEADKLLTNPLVGGLAIESFSTLLSMSLYKPNIKRANNTYELMLDIYLSDDEIKYIQDRIAGTDTKIVITSTPGEAKKIKITNIKSQKEAINIFGKIIRDR